MLIMMMCIAFTMINMHVIQARRIFNNVKVEVAASNGAFVPARAGGRFTYDSNAIEGINIRDNGYQFQFYVERKELVDSNIGDDDQTFIYNSMYEVKMSYAYSVPFFGMQVYSQNGFVY